MPTEVKVPHLPESVEDATVDTWHKKPGDKVKRDENLVDLETDKVVLEVPAPTDGVLKEIRIETGETVKSDEVLAIIESGGEGEDKAEEEKKEEDEEPEKDEKEEAQKEKGKKKARKKKKAEKKTHKEQEEKEEEEEAPEDEDEEEEAPEDEEEEEEAPEDKDEEEEAPEDKDEEEEEREEKKKAKEDGSRLSPAARRVAEEEDVDTSKLSGTGRGGRVTKGDVLSFLKGGGSRQEERVKMTRLRRRIAERLKDAQDTAAILTSFNEVDMKAVMDLRRRHKDAFQEKHGIKLGVMSFFVKACCEALRRHPIVNASIDGDDIVYHNYQDIGIAVSTERGLMVPILRNAETMGLAEIEKAIEHYATAARDGTIDLEDLQGGTFTITNGGVFGSLVSTPLLNPPQSAILGMHAIKERPVVVDGEIVARPMMYLALSYDHRLIDGKDAVLFLVTVRDLLEDPARMLLNV